MAFGTPSAIANSVTFGAGYTWNITSPTPGIGGNSTNPYNLDALECAVHPQRHVEYDQRLFRDIWYAGRVEAALR